MPRERPHGVCITLAYDGTDFVGWQRQPEQRTVQSVVRAAVREMDPEGSRLRGASRTDAGVHATGQVAAFGTYLAIPAHGWVHALNARLPQDVAVWHAEPCAPDFNPRFAASRKLYRYVLQARPTRDPLTRHRVWHIGSPLARPDVPFDRRGTHVSGWLDVDAMRRAAAHMVGTHDFRAFRSSNDRREKTVRSLHAVHVRDGWGGRDDQLAIEVLGDAFLKHMVRIIAGTLVDVGRGRIDADALPRLLGSSAERHDAGPTAPPQGLTLVHVELERG